MTTKHVYNIIDKAMSLLEDVDFISLDKRKYNQAKINKAYNILDNFRDEIIREDIKNKQGGTNDRERS